MKLNYQVVPKLVEKLIAVTHKGKRRGFRHPMNAHGARAHEMIYVDYGCVVLNLSGTEIRITPGECVFIPGGAGHAFVGENEAPFYYLNIMFIGDPPPSLFGKNIPVNGKCLELMKKLSDESVQEMPYCREIMGSVLTELVARLLRIVESSVPKNLPEAVNQHRYKSLLVNKALAIIADEYASHLSIKQLSRAAGIGESRLAKLLKSETGETFCSLLHQQRVTAAKHLLCEGTFSLEEIAMTVGYQSSSFFYKIFKRVAGMTPKAYSRSLGDPVSE